MQPMVAPLTDQDIADLAAYFSQQTPTGNEADPSYWKAGEKLFRGGDAKRGIPACLACHGPVGRGNPAAGYPGAADPARGVHRQAAQRLRHRNALHEGRQGQVPRADPIPLMMNTIAARLTAEDRRDLASYIQGMR